MGRLVAHPWIYVARLPLKDNSLVSAELVTPLVPRLDGQWQSWIALKQHGSVQICCLAPCQIWWPGPQQVWPALLDCQL